MLCLDILLMFQLNGLLFTKNSKIHLPYFCTLACPERFAEIYKKIKNHKSPHGVGIKTVFESQKTWQQGKRQY